MPSLDLLDQDAKYQRPSLSLLDDAPTGKPSLSLLDEPVRTPGNVVFPDYGSTSDPSSAPSPIGPVTQSTPSPYEPTWDEALSGLAKEALVPPFLRQDLLPEEVAAVRQKLGPAAMVAATMAIPTPAGFLGRAALNYALGTGVETGIRSLPGEPVIEALQRSATNLPGRAIDIGIAGLPNAIGLVGGALAARRASKAATEGSLTIPDVIRPTPKLGTEPFGELPTEADLSALREQSIGWRSEIKLLEKSSDPEAQQLGTALGRSARNIRAIEGLGGFKKQAIERGAEPGELNWLVALRERARAQDTGSGLPELPPATAQRMAQTENLLSEFAQAKQGTWTRRDGELVPWEGIGQGYFPRRPPLVGGEDLGRLSQWVERARESGGTSLDVIQGGGPSTKSLADISRSSEVRTFPPDFSRELGEYITGSARNIALQKAFGKPSFYSKGFWTDQEFYMGEDLARSIASLIGKGKMREAAAALSAGERLYKRSEGLEGAGMRLAKQLTSRVLLPRSFAANFSQFGTPGWFFSPHEIVEGFAQVRHNSELGTLPMRFGATESGWLDYLRAEGADVHDIAMRRLGTVEHGLRRFSAFGAVGRAYRVAQEAAEAIKDGREIPAATQFLAKEMDADPLALARELMDSGRLSEPTLGNAMQTLSDKLQFQLGPGEIGRNFTTGPWSLLGMYKAFSARQSGLIKEAIWEPLATPGLRTIGLGRLARFTVAAPVSGGIASIGRSLIAGRLPTVGQVGADILSSGLGMAGDVAQAGLRQREPERIGQEVTGAPMPELVARVLGEGVQSFTPSARPALEAEMLLRYGVPLLHPRRALEAQFLATRLRELQR